MCEDLPLSKARGRKPSVLTRLMFFPSTPVPGICEASYEGRRLYTDDSSGTRFCCQSRAEIAVVFEAKVLVGYQLCEYTYTLFFLVEFSVGAYNLFHEPASFPARGGREETLADEMRPGWGGRGDEVLRNG